MSSGREMLERTFVVDPDSEHILLAAVKLEAENGKLEVEIALQLWLRPGGYIELLCHLFLC